MKVTVIFDATGSIQELALSAAATYSKSKIRVNTISPGLTDTPLAKRITSNESALAQSIAMHPLGRIGRTSFAQLNGLSIRLMIG